MFATTCPVLSAHAHPPLSAWVHTRGGCALAARRRAAGEAGGGGEEGSVRDSGDGGESGAGAGAGADADADADVKSDVAADRGDGEMIMIMLLTTRTMTMIVAGGVDDGGDDPFPFSHDRYSRYSLSDFCNAGFQVRMSSSEDQM
eukprot:702400-Rhodomonas_salina.3